MIKKEKQDKHSTNLSCYNLPLISPAKELK